MARDQNVRVDQVLADNDPIKTGDKMEAVIANRIQEDWVLCGVAAQESKSTFAPLPTAIHLVFVKPEGRRVYGTGGAKPPPTHMPSHGVNMDGSRDEDKLKVSPAGFTAKQWETVERFANEVPDKYQMPSPDEFRMQQLSESAVIVAALLGRLGTNKVTLSAAQLLAAPRASSVWFEKNREDGSVTIEVKP